MGDDVERYEIDRSSALIVVDTQNCFCPGGSLPVPDGDGVVPVRARGSDARRQWASHKGNGEKGRYPRSSRSDRAEQGMRTRDRGKEMVRGEQPSWGRCPRIARMRRTSQCRRPQLYLCRSQWRQQGTENSRTRSLCTYLDPPRSSAELRL